MRFLIQAISIATLAFVLELFMPWWSVSIAAFAGGLLLRSNANFGAGFFAIATLWTMKAIYVDIHAATLLIDNVAQIFQLPGKLFLFIVMAAIGGLVGGFSALSGSLIEKKRTFRR